MNRRIFRQSIAAGALIAFMAGEAAAYQFGGIFGRSSSSNDEENACDTVGENAGRSIIGGLLGSVGRSVGIPVFVPVETFSDVLASEIACRLDPEEQEKAAAATEEVTRSAEVGDTAEWESETREDVRGRSTVTARNDNAGNGRSCLDVTDVIIVGGEETTVTKQMCRGPGESRYTLVA